MSQNSSCDTDDVSDYGDKIPPEIYYLTNQKDYTFQLIIILNRGVQLKKPHYLLKRFSWHISKIYQKPAEIYIFANIMESFLDAENHHKNF